MDFDELEFNSEEQVSTQPDKADYVLSDEDETPEICEGTEKTESTERTDEICGSEQVTEIIHTEPTPPEAQEVSEFPEGFDEIPDDDLSEDFSEPAEESFEPEEEIPEPAEESFEPEEEKPEPAEELIEPQEEIPEQAEELIAPEEEIPEAAEELIEPEEEIPEPAEESFEPEEEISEPAEELIVPEEEIPEPAEESFEPEEEISEPAEESFEPEDKISSDIIAGLVDGLKVAFTDHADTESEDVSADGLSRLADNLSGTVTDGTEQSIAMQEQQSETANEADDSEDDLPYDEPTKIYVKNEKKEKKDHESFLSDDALDEIETKCADVDLSEPQQSDQDYEMERTHVFDPVRPQASYGETYGRGEYWRNNGYEESVPRRKGGFFKGMTLIAGLLAVVAGLVWLLSTVAFSVMGGENYESADEYDYSSGGTIIRPFVDDALDTPPIVIPEFTADKLAVGDSGDMVLAVQRTLASLGYLPSAKVTGTYDNATKEAVRQFQKANLLNVTGEVDKTTYDLIFDSNAVAPTTTTTDLPTTTESETSATVTETTTAPTQTETSTATSKETEPTSTTAASIESEVETTESAASTTSKSTETSTTTEAPVSTTEESAEG